MQCNGRKILLVNVTRLEEGKVWQTGTFIVVTFEPVIFVFFSKLLLSGLIGREIVERLEKKQERIMCVFFLVCRNIR